MERPGLQIAVTIGRKAWPPVALGFLLSVYAIYARFASGWSTYHMGPATDVAVTLILNELEAIRAAVLNVQQPHYRVG
jgi:hypothetical protein